MEPGDIVMLSRELTDKQTGKPFIWRLLALVIESSGRRRSVFTVMRLDTLEDMKIDTRDDRWIVEVLAEERWPDGARVARMRAAMEGRLDDLI